MAELLSILKQANSNLHFEKDVVERRAEMAAQCECLALWIEGRECVCGDKTINIPLSTENLKKAHSLIGQIENCDNRLAQVSKIESDNVSCAVELGRQKIHHPQMGLVYIDDGGDYRRSGPTVTLPKAVLIASLKEERIRLMIALHKTGIVSVDRPNIKANPK